MEEKKGTFMYSFSLRNELRSFIWLIMIKFLYFVTAIKYIKNPGHSKCSLEPDLFNWKNTVVLIMAYPSFTWYSSSIFFATFRVSV